MTISSPILQRGSGAPGGARSNGISAGDRTGSGADVGGWRQHGRQGRIRAVLEPRSSTMKRGVMKDALAWSVEPADRIYVYTEGLSWDAPAVFASLGTRARCVGDLEALVAAVAAEARAGDHVLVMSNGGVGW